MVDSLVAAERRLVLGLRRQEVTHRVSLALCVRPWLSRRCGHVVGLRFGEGPARCFAGTVRSFLLTLPKYGFYDAWVVEVFEARWRPHYASQAEASPRVDVGEVSQAPGDKAARSFKDQNSCTRGGSNKGCFSVTVLSGKTLTMTASLDSSTSSVVHDVSSITGIPVEKFYLVVAGASGGQTVTSSEERAWS